MRKKKIWQAASLLMAAVIFIMPALAMDARAAEEDGPRYEGISGDLGMIEEEIEEELIEFEEYEEAEEEEGEEDSFYDSEYEEASIDLIYNARADVYGTVFYRDRLSDNEALVYDALAQNSTYDDPSEYVPYNTYSCVADDTQGAKAQDPISSEERLTAACAVLFDHPEIYWTQNIRTKYTYRKKGTDFVVTTSVCFVDNLPGGHSEYEDAVVYAAQEMLDRIDTSGSDAATACRIHEALAAQTDYEEYEPGTDAYIYSHSAYGAIVNGSAVCDGYAKAYHLLLSLSGIESAVIASLDHAWNVLELDGKWYECDVTWDDQLGVHWYFNAPTQEMRIDSSHRRDESSVSRYAPWADGEYYCWDYMQYCGQEFENAGPEGQDAFLSAEKDGSWHHLSDLPGDTSWTVGIRTEEGTSFTGSIYKGSLSSSLTVSPFGRASAASLKKNQKTMNGDFEVNGNVEYDNGAKSVFNDKVKVKTVADTISFKESSIDMIIGDKIVLAVTKTPSAASDTITYTSSDTSVADVEAGLVTAAGRGRCTITAKGEKAGASVTVNVYPKTDGITISRTSLSIAKGSQASLTAALTPAGARGNIKWETSSPSVAVVDNGRVTAIRKGTCTITASCDSFKKTCQVTVTSVPEDITGLVSGVTIYRGKTYTLKANVYPSDAPQAKSFSSSSAAVASVDSAGTITGVKKGECTVTVAAGNVKKTVKVTVKEPAAGISLEKTSLTMEKGSAENIGASVLPAQAQEDIVYVSSAPAVASVDKAGNVKALKAGTAVVTAQVKGTSYKKTCSVKVLMSAPASTKAEIRETGIKVSWDAVEGAAYYEVYKKQSVGPYESLIITDGTSYIDKQTPQATICRYKVRCIEKDRVTEASSFGDEASATYFPSPVVELEGIKDGVKVTWNKITDVDGYRVYMLRQDGTTWKKLGTFTETSYVHTTAVKGRSYTFKVRCVKDGQLASYKKSGPQMIYTKAPSVPTVQKVNGKAVIRWNKVDKARKYAVLQKQKDGSWKIVHTTSQTSYPWPVTKKGTTFTVAIRCLDNSSTFFTGAASTAKTYTIK